MEIHFHSLETDSLEYVHGNSNARSGIRSIRSSVPVGIKIVLLQNVREH
jgi:hypothetical protein